MPARPIKKKTVVKKKSQSRATANKSKSPAKSKPPSAKSPTTDFAPVFAALKNVMSAHADELHAAFDEPRKYYLVTKSLSWRGGPMFFGAVIWGGAYVSYHLMPLYISPALVKTISPALKRRMQGKACFNFRQIDEDIFEQLGAVTKSCLEYCRSSKRL
jgi:hypothetical protein